jgi:Fungal Zn(2)-Cys(6) binuclear cluster domain
MSTQQTATSDRKMEPKLTPAQQLNRSCESCRSLKVRCLPDANVPSQCQRCAKAKRTCIFVAPQRRRPRKRTDSRVAQLEKEMAAMRTVLKGRRIVIEENLDEDSEPGREDEADEDDTVDFGSEAIGKTQPTHQDVQFTTPVIPFNRPFLHDSSQSPGYRSSPQMSGDGNSSLSTPALTLNSIDKGNEGDVIDRGVILMSTAEDLVSLFINDLMIYFPFIVFPAKMTARHLRNTKPTLFLAILAASSIAVDDGLANTLNREMLALYAQRFFLRGEKSLEMVQALLLMNIYYLPPASPSQIQAYQYPHIAATMALEIGIASKKRIPRRSTQNQTQTQRQSNPVDNFDEQMAEQARTILACYHLASK